MDSILNSIKKLLGITPEYTHFDQDIIMHINSTFPILYQIGVDEALDFKITDESNVWEDFIKDQNFIELIKIYIYLKVRLLFDPPTIGSVMDSLNRTIEQYEWRINVALDSFNKEN